MECKDTGGGGQDKDFDDWGITAEVLPSNSFTVKEVRAPQARTEGSEYLKAHVWGCQHPHGAS